jgi:hypothetical protein
MLPLTCDGMVLVSRMCFVMNVWTKQRDLLIEETLTFVRGVAVNERSHEATPFRIVTRRLVARFDTDKAQRKDFHLEALDHARNAADNPGLADRDCSVIAMRRSSANCARPVLEDARGQRLRAEHDRAAGPRCSQVTGW